MRPDPARSPRRARGDVDDPSPSARPHSWNHRARAQKGRFQVDGDGAVEILLGQSVDILKDRDPGIVHQHIDRSKRIRDRSHHRIDARPKRHIRPHRHRAPSQSVDRRDNFQCLLLPVLKIHRHIRARPGQRERHRLANAA